MGKREIVKAVVKDISDISSIDGYVHVKTTNNGTDSPYYSYRIKDNCYCIFRYTFSGRGCYSINGSMYIRYKILTDIMLDLMRCTNYEDDYKIIPTDSFIIRGVGIWSEIGRHLKNTSALYIENIGESRDFARLFYSQVKQEEAAFILPAMDIKTTIEKFMKPTYYFWPGDLRSFVEHLVSYGIMTSDKQLIDYAFEKASSVILKYSEDVRKNYSDFIEALRTTLNNAKLLVT